MKSKFHIGFTWTIEQFDEFGVLVSKQTKDNIMPIPAINYFWEAALRGGSAYSAWYLSLFNANRLPVSTDTMTTLMADCEENVDYTVTSGQRPLITIPAAADGTITTLADPNIIVFTGAATIRGGLVTSNITRGNNAGLLISAVRFDSPVTIGSGGGSLRTPIGFALVSS